jgi:hypothetical protein
MLGLQSSTTTPSSMIFFLLKTSDMIYLKISLCEINSDLLSNSSLSTYMPGTMLRGMKIIVYRICFIDVCSLVQKKEL